MKYLLLYIYIYIYIYIYKELPLNKSDKKFARTCMRKLKKKKIFTTLQKSVKNSSVDQIDLFKNYLY